MGRAMTVLSGTFLPIITGPLRKKGVIMPPQVVNAGPWGYATPVSPASTPAGFVSGSGLNFAWQSPWGGLASYVATACRQAGDELELQIAATGGEATPNSLMFTLPTVFPAPIAAYRLFFQCGADGTDIGTAQVNTDRTVVFIGVANGIDGIPGGPVAIPYTFSTTTTDSDPGTGNLRLSNATQTSATVIRADLLANDGSSWGAVLATFADSTNTVKGHIRLVKADDPSQWLVFTISAVASPSGYKNITVANVAGSSSSPFVNGDSIVLFFERAGDVGTNGTNGVGVPTGGSTGQVLEKNSVTDYDTSWQTPSAGAGVQVAIIQHQAASGTHGGGTSNGAWRTRPLTTIVSDPHSLVSLSSNQFTLGAGTYLIRCEGELGIGNSNGSHRLQNITDSATAGLGMSTYNQQTSDNSASIGTVVAQVVLTGSKTFEFQYQVQFTVGSFGLGVATSFGTECYATVTIEKIA